MNEMLTGRLLKNEKLAKYTSWRVGGPAKQIYFPADKDDLMLFLSRLPKQEKVFWMGLGSNLLVRDGGIDATVINTRTCLKTMHVTGQNTIHVEAGVYCAQVARFCSNQGFTGGEFLAGIPGTMGGALNMNAGAFGGVTWDIIKAVEMISMDGQIIRRDADEFKVEYRKVEKKPEEWFLSATLGLPMAENDQSYDKIRRLLAKRSQTQPLNQLTCGSVFKNPDGDYAARLIETSGLKGCQIGQAQVSEKHANFIINCGDAKAIDIEKLIEHIQIQVFQQHGIKLQTEVCIVGEKECL